MKLIITCYVYLTEMKLLFRGLHSQLVQLNAACNHYVKHYQKIFVMVSHLSSSK